MLEFILYCNGGYTMPEVNSFKDRNGKKGSVGSKVYHYMLDIGKASDELKLEDSKIVEKIYSRGAAGTQLLLTGENGSNPASSYILIDL